mgnify:CR=1 FL=1
MEYFKKYEPLFGAWHITRLIGEGSFGKVFEIERKDFGKTYKSALKAITIPQNQSEIKNLSMSGMDSDSVTTYFNSLVENVAKEFELMSEMKGHSNIVSYEDHNVFKHEDGIGWDILIRMELLTPADSFFSENGIDNEKVIRLGIDLCKALEVCQKHNVVHRDIKPSNIFVSSNGDFKLGDFGVAKTIEQTTGDFSKKGTHNYMAPEVYKGESYGNSVDLYSVGIVMYRYLNNNRTPFLPQPPEMITYNKSEEALTRRMRGEELSPPVNANKELTRIILKACSFEPANRYSSPALLRRELENLMSASGYQSGKDIPSVPPTKPDVFEETAKPSPRPYKFPFVDEPDNFDDTFSGGDLEDGKNNNSEKKKTAIICGVCTAILALIIGGAFLFKNNFLKINLREFFANLSSSTQKVEETAQTTDASTAFFELSSLEMTTEQTSQIMFVKTAGSDLNMREKATVDSPIMAKIPVETPVYILKTEADWSYVEYNGQKGWVKSEFLSFETATTKNSYITQPVKTTIATTRKPTTTKKVTTTRKSTTTKKPTTTAKITTTKRITTTVDSLRNYDYVNEWANLKIDLPYGYTDQTKKIQSTNSQDPIAFVAMNPSTVSSLMISISPFDADDIDDITIEQALYILSNQYISAVGENYVKNISGTYYSYLGNEKYSYLQWEDHSKDNVLYVRYYLRRIDNKYICMAFTSEYSSEINTMVWSIDSIS